MTTQPFDTTRTMEPLNYTKLAEELVFALGNTTLKTRQTNVPGIVQTTTKDVLTVKGVPDLIELLQNLEKAVVDSAPKVPDIQKVELTNPAKEVEIPAFPKDISATLKDLPELKKALEGITKSIDAKDFSPTIESPTVKVDAPNLIPISNGLIDLSKQLKDSLKYLKSIEEKEYPVTDFKPLSKEMKKIKDSIDMLVFPSPDKLPRDASGNVSITSQNALITKPYNMIEATYPDNKTEVYTYKLGNAVQDTVTVLYTTPTKDVLTSVTKS